jgi:PAS domain S-box-containing protein
MRTWVRGGDVIDPALALAPLFAAAVSLALALYVYQRRPAPGSRMLALLAASAGIWAFGYGLELASPDPESLRFWVRVQYLGIATTPLVWFLFVRSYLGDPLSRGAAWSLAALPILTVLLVWTNDWHGLVHADPRIVSEDGRFRFVPEYGPYFWLHTAYAYALTLLGAGQLLMALWRSPGRYAGQLSALVLAALLPLTANLVYVLRLWPPSDLTPIGFALSALLIAWPRFRYRLLDLVPIACSVVMDSLEDAVLVLDEEERIIDANPAAHRLVGRQSGLLGKRLDEVFTGRSEVLERYRALAKPHRETIVAAGRFFELQFSPLSSRGRQRGQVVVLRDISRQVQTEAELRDAKEVAEAANQAKSQFLANMSHELRTPLTLIIGFAELFGDDDLDAAKRREYARNILASGQHLFGLIDEVLTFAKLEEGLLALEPSEFDLAALCREVARAVKPRLTQQGNSLALELAGDLGRVHTDAEKVRQILMQLLDNAGKFTKGGKVTLSAYRRDGDRGEGEVVLQVTDTGIGIAPEHLPSIFGAFVQVDGSSTRRYGGSGLGLALAERFCRLLKGRISVQSSLGVGSSFTVVLPAELPAITLNAAQGSMERALEAGY